MCIIYMYVYYICVYTYIYTYVCNGIFLVFHTCYLACRGKELACTKNSKPICLPDNRVCDGVRDCDDGKDEHLCYRLISDMNNYKVGTLMSILVAKQRGRQKR